MAPFCYELKPIAVSLWCHTLAVCSMRFRISLFLCLSAALLAIIFGGAPSVWAQPAPAPKVTEAPVEVGGRQLFSVTGADETEALRRADLINGRLQRLIERDADVPRFSPSNDVTMNGTAPTISLGGEEIVTLTPLDAAQSGASVSQLAPEWGYALSSAVRASRVARGGPFGGLAVTLASSLTDLALGVVAWVPRLLGALVLALLFWFIARGVRALTKRASARRAFRPESVAVGVGGRVLRRVGAGISGDIIGPGRG